MPNNAVNSLTSGSPAVSIVVPVYRSAQILPTLVEETRQAMQSLGLENRFEIVFVNDASPDNSWETIRTIAAQHSFVRGLRLRKNVGQHNALMAGLRQSRGELVVLMDDDLQHPPQAIGAMIDALSKGFDVCYTRYRNRQHATWKRLGSRFNDAVASLLLDKPRNLYLSSFKAMRRPVVDEVIKYDGPFTYLDGLILGVTGSITSVDIEHRSRLEGASNYTVRKLISLWLKMATSFSVAPLRLATYLGFLLSGISVLMILFVVVSRLTHPDFAPGWASLMAAILLIGGIQTFCIGLIGEYLGRTYLKINGKPQYSIAEVTDQPVQAP
ncbi:glycosyltransferase family 2 protein [Hydrogenophaga pseudoflava]|jgi:undecaprenyl-phosphate 4-deoxy-4-formamido-L-arabinose transferase|uniref:glycosyltransferase family 2 protein n=1 Tax=Hydrogenophaga pseudoflava TaxID=47421 RepID=UPI000A020A69|nr:glycosyltransferase family 2 protein [Hydrogenophaga pseudoflava]